MPVSSARFYRHRERCFRGAAHSGRDPLRARQCDTCGRRRSVGHEPRRTDPAMPKRRSADPRWGSCAGRDADHRISLRDDREGTGFQPRSSPLPFTRCPDPRSSSQGPSRRPRRRGRRPRARFAPGGATAVRARRSSRPRWSPRPRRQMRQQRCPIPRQRRRSRQRRGLQRRHRPRRTPDLGRRALRIRASGEQGRRPAPHRNRGIAAANAASRARGSARRAMPARKPAERAGTQAAAPSARAAVLTRDARGTHRRRHRARRRAVRTSGAAATALRPARPRRRCRPGRRILPRHATRIPTIRACRSG